jgi:hypothetical protein
MAFTKKMGEVQEIEDEAFNVIYHFRFQIDQIQCSIQK